MMTALRFLVMLVMAQAGLMTPASALEPLTQVEKIRSLSREETAQALPVKLTGVVIYNSWSSLVLHDGKASIYLDFEHASRKGVWNGNFPNLRSIEPGTGVEVEGLTDPGGFSPMVMVAKFRAIGPMPIPPPLRPTPDEMLSSSHDSRWVEVEGVVRKVEDPANGPRYLSLLVGGHPCPVLVTDRRGLSREQLVDAKVRVRGVMLNIANLRSQTAGMKIHSSGKKDIDILVPPPSDPFRAPKVALNLLISYRPDADLGHRRVSSGVVTFAVPGRFFYLLDQQACVRVDSAEAQVTVGDLVEVSGFIDTSKVLASFSEAMVRKIGTGTVPPPDEPSISEILSPKTRSPEEMVTAPGSPDCNGRLIRLRGVLRRVLPPDRDGNATVVVESGEHLVQAFVPVAPGVSARWVVGSVIALTGVCELEMARLDKLPWFSITGFHVWLSSPDGLQVISQPPWWTPRRLGILLAAMLLVLGLTLAWGYAMRRQVAARGTQLAAEISARESAQLKFDTILHERRRLANDLHDTLEQALTGLALQLEIASRSRSSDPALSGRHLNLAQQFLEQSRSEAHRTVWDLRAHGQDGRDFLDILDERVSSMVEGSGTTITLKREGGPVPMPDLIAGNLLLLAQEAVTNSLKHSAASEIAILLRLSPGHAELVVEDNGCGFDPSAAPGQHDGHFGLQGMRERTKRIGGRIDLKSSPGRGTILRVGVPCLEDSDG
jgi:signal transduction histidine kinase